ncbi:MAG: TldD/PmbA family protein [Paracoccaceae bacterium]|nr:TldD/PmbA family protein [Paracoccaceae bacterium]
MPRPLSDLTDAMLSAARKAGADNADAVAVDGTSVSIDVLHGKLEHAERSEGIDIGLRVIIGQRQACVSSSDTRDETISAMAERAVAMAREAPEDDTIGLAEPGQLADDLGSAHMELCDPAAEPSAQSLQDAACEAEAAALAVAGVAQVQSAAAGHGRHRIHLAATNGFSGGYEKSSNSLYCVAISGEGLKMERDYYGDQRVFQSDLENPALIGRLAGARAVAAANPRKPKTGAYPVIFDERVSASLIGHLLGAINGSAIVRGASWARSLLGEQVLPKGLDLIEDPLRHRAGGSKPFDAEGLQTARRAIVKDGVLTGWTLDLATARKLGMESTANAARGTSSPPSPSNGNIALTQGTQSREDLMQEIGTGLLVTSMIGSTISATTGDYSRGTTGFWVENGEIAYPVNECTIAGNLVDMLKRITPANDARTHLSRVVPSLLVEGLTIAGE